LEIAERFELPVAQAKLHGALSVLHEHQGDAESARRHREAAARLGGKPPPEGGSAL
jgi:hypothetical protein